MTNKQFIEYFEDTCTKFDLLDLPFDSEDFGHFLSEVLELTYGEHGVDFDLLTKGYWDGQDAI